MGLESRETVSFQGWHNLPQPGGATLYHRRLHSLWQATTFLEEPQRYKRILREVATTSIADSLNRRRNIFLQHLEECQARDEAADTEPGTGFGASGEPPTLPIIVDSEEDEETLEQKRNRLDRAETEPVRQFARCRQHG